MDESERVHVLYERTRAVEQAAKEAELELSEVAGQVRVALADLRRAERSWAARVSHRTRRGSAQDEDASALRRVATALEALGERLSAHAQTPPPGEP